MKTPKISVIVPIYNTSKYLKKCLECLVSQDYNNLEIILVEDCSTDNSESIAKKYLKYKNVIYIQNEKNSGLSYSRNIGLAKATGEYIGYVDSDDYVDSNYYSNLMNSILIEKSDIAICDIKVIYERTNDEIISRCCEGNFNKLSVINTGLAASACNKLFKRELIKNYEFSVGKVNEDIAVIIPTIIKAKKISYAPKTYYNYVQHDNSIQNSRFSMKRFDIFYGVDLTLQRIKGCKDFNLIKQSLVFNQLIVLLIYVLPKEKNFFRRLKLLKKFNKCSKKYNIRQNRLLWDFLDRCGAKHRYYYKILFKLNCLNLYLFVDLLIVAYDFLSLFKRKSVIRRASMEDLIREAKRQNKLSDSKIKISVVIPNYNYARFLYQRLYSVLYQKQKIYEIIILDDCSKDNSREEIDKIEKVLNKYIKIKKIYNKENSGTAFKQWQKGFKEVSGNYVWIAEADDYCESNLMTELVKPIKKESNIIISYSDTAFIDVSGNIILKSIKPEIDIQKSGHWDRSYVNNGIQEIRDYSYLNCTIANVSSTLIKNGDYSEFLSESSTYKQAGDWLFYVNAIASGKIAYSKKILNYYRLHGNNVSSTMNYKKHLEEIKKIHKYYIKKFDLTEKHQKEMAKRIKFLEKVWKIKN